MHEVTDSGKNIFLIDTKFTRLLEVVGKDIQKDLGVGVGINVSMSIGIEETFKFMCVD